MSKIEAQIARAEARWQKTSEKREVVQHELDKLEAGESPDWRQLDVPSRVVHRLERLGQVEAAEALVDRDDQGFNPLERIIGTSQLTGIEFFERGLIAARTVARIEVRGGDGRLTGYGSGVLVSPCLLLTNNHVLESKATAAGSVAQFEYLTSAAGLEREPLPFRLLPGNFFITDEALDFTLVAVEPENDAGELLRSRGWCPLIPGSGKAIVGERVNIIQHPSGERMQVAVRDNTVVAVIEDFMQYVADTQPGSSGSPVFNEQWEMAALHHAGVPRRDSHGRILMRDGRPWTRRREDVDQIDWQSNEGVRVSRIVTRVNAERLTISERALWEAVFVPPRPLTLWDLFRSSGQEAFPANPVDVAGRPGRPRHGYVGSDGTASWLFRLSFGPASGSALAASPAMAANSGDAPPAGYLSAAIPRQARKAPPPTSGDVQDVAERILERYRHEGPYYDEKEDRRASEGYYKDIDWDTNAEHLFQQLHRLLKQTHHPQHSYARARHQFLYPAIDLHEDNRLRNIYSGTVLDPVEAIARELTAVVLYAEARGLELNGSNIEGLLEHDDLWDELENEATGPVNCEHVVPQSWFEKREPMRADLHHLFACEPGCNSFRSNIPYWQFSPEDEVQRTDCGRREGNKFEPEKGKGAVARATLYFLVRYPGEVGDNRRELTHGRLKVLLDWHNNFPVGTYERHRNWLTHKAQGNRNPFIDRPEVASEMLLRLGFGES